MAQKRILSVQDISCVGRCSLTVALPILSSCGHETCILPTAVLSTHTGGFVKPVVHHLGDDVKAICRHWQSEGVLFDAISTGYLGSTEAIDAVFEMAEYLLKEGGVLIVDPAMADHGKLYSGLTIEYAQRMKELCEKADIILPNITEAAIFADIPWEKELNEAYIDTLLDKIQSSNIVLTGVGYEADETGVEVCQDGKRFHYSHQKVGQNFHGTGDIFAATFVGAYMHGKSISDSATIAADFTRKCIEMSIADPAGRFGVRFELAIPELIKDIY